MLDLRALFALLSFSALYVGNDGGILHSAVALRVPTVGLFGAWSDTFFPYESWGPYRSVGVRDVAASMRDISLSDVVGAVDEVLAKASR